MGYSVFVHASEISDEGLTFDVVFVDDICFPRVSRRSGTNIPLMWPGRIVNELYCQGRIKLIPHTRLPTSCTSWWLTDRSTVSQMTAQLHNQDDTQQTTAPSTLVLGRATQEAESRKRPDSACLSPGRPETHSSATTARAGPPLPDFYSCFLVPCSAVRESRLWLRLRGGGLSCSLSGGWGMGSAVSRQRGGERGYADVAEIIEGALETSETIGKKRAGRSETGTRCTPGST